MSTFTVRGRFRHRQGWQAFERVVDAVNEDVAIEHTYAELGSEHGLTRTQIDIEEIET